MDILYVGSWLRATVKSIRLPMHQQGRARQTAKCAARDGVDLTSLRMVELQTWTSDADGNPEGRVTRALQAKGQCRWNFPHTLSHEDTQKGGQRSMELGVGFHTPKARRTGGKYSQPTLRRLKVGPFYDPVVKGIGSKKGGHNAQAVLRVEGKGFYDPKTGSKGGRNAQAILRQGGKGLYNPEVRWKGNLAGKGKGAIARNAKYGSPFKGPMKTHMRWHVLRGQGNPSQCQLCATDWEKS